MLRWLTRDRPNLTVGHAAITVVVLLVGLFAVGLVAAILELHESRSSERRLMHTYLTSLQLSDARELGGVRDICRGDSSLQMAVRRVQLPGTKERARAAVASEAERRGWVQEASGVFHRPEAPGPIGAAIHLFVEVSGPDGRPIVELTTQGTEFC